MSRLPILLVTVLFVAVSADGAETWSPSNRDLQRYQDIWSTSPFVVASPPVLPVNNQEQKYAITGYAKIGRKDIVFLLDRISLTRFPISKDQEENGVRLVSLVSEAQNPSARIRVSNQEYEISMDTTMAEMQMQVQRRTPPADNPEAYGTRDK